MAKLTTVERKALPKSDFAVPSKAPGLGSYPMPDAAHAAVAKGMASQHAGPSVEKKVDAKANKVLGNKDAEGKNDPAPKNGPEERAEAAAKRPKGKPSWLDSFRKGMAAK